MIAFSISMEQKEGTVIPLKLLTKKKSFPFFGHITGFWFCLHHRLFALYSKMLQYDKIMCPLNPEQPYRKCNTCGYIFLKDKFSSYPFYLQYKQRATFSYCFVYFAAEILEAYDLKYKVFQTGLNHDQVIEKVRNLPKDAVEGK